MKIQVNRKPNRFYPDPERVIARFFMPGDPERARNIINKVLQLDDGEVHEILTQILMSFSSRHRNISKIFEKHFISVMLEVDFNPGDMSLERKLLIGSYFTMEYSIESAAFFNPSIVEDPDQSNLDRGEKRVILSFRATGEGHISSIAFRRGILDNNNNLIVNPARKLVEMPDRVKRHLYKKDQFINKLKEMKIEKDVVGLVLDPLEDEFLYGELLGSIQDQLSKKNVSYSRKQVIKAIQWLANSHYEMSFSLDTSLSERVIFPVSYSESNGIEDARFVRFVDDDGQVTYYATYTAYNGYTILPKLLETRDFYNFKVSPINGEHAQNKGMALFPRKINGKYAMLARIDGVNNFIMYSANKYLWDDPKLIQEPQYPWEFIQVGNSGSPIETELGWLVLTHGVGPMRRYSLGITLLDLHDPSKVIGRLKEPILVPNDEEREGYVPNVVYSCGAMLHNDELIIPYALSDYASSVVSVSLHELMRQLMEEG